MYFTQEISLCARTIIDAGHRVNPYHPPQTGAQAERRPSYSHAAVIEAAETETAPHNDSGTQKNGIHVEVKLLCKITRLGEKYTNIFTRIIPALLITAIVTSVKSAN
jgi:hypothetical protein